MTGKRPGRVKDVFVFGGPNGAGKTTIAQRILPTHLGIRQFANADEIARGISPFDPEGAEIAAARLLLHRIHALARSGESFAFETTCAGRGHARLLRQCRDMGYRITLIFLWLPSPQAALARVARRVSQGGHDVAPDVVVRRFWSGIRNLRRLYLPLADVGLICDNADEGRVLIAEKLRGNLRVLDPPRWRMIEEVTR